MGSGRVSWRITASMEYSSLKRSPTLGQGCQVQQKHPFLALTSDMFILTLPNFIRVFTSLKKYKQDFKESLFMIRTPESDLITGPAPRLSGMNQNAGVITRIRRCCFKRSFPYSWERKCFRKLPHA